MDYTIAEEFTLPSKGKIYGVKVNETVKLRSMTVEEEMLRLSRTDTPYKTLCDIIDSCMTENIGISSYDMHIGDYQFLLHKLRVVTYGADYPIITICPICGKQNKQILNLDDIKVFSIDTDDDLNKFNESLEVFLPKTQKNIKIKFQTPRDFDEISTEERRFRENSPESKYNISYLYTLRHCIDTIDGKRINPVSLDLAIKKLPMMDSNLILKRVEKISNMVGIDTNVLNVCSNPKCGAKYNTTFRITNEFFGPSED